jgi:hypothetical protein
MTELSRRSLLAGTGAAIAAWPLRAAGDARNADLVVRGARIHTMASSAPQAEAFAVRDAGSSPSVQAMQSAASSAAAPKSSTLAP